MMIINKRYKDIFLQYIYRGEPTPLSLGTLVVCGLCFLLLIIATFTQFNFTHPWFQNTLDSGVMTNIKTVSYNPMVPAMIFIIYLLGIGYSYLMFSAYLITGFFIWPIFVFGGGFGYIENYLFGYLLGFIFANFAMNMILKINPRSVLYRILSGIAGVVAIHLCGFIYCIILAIFGRIEFSIIIPILKIITFSKILYDILFSTLILLVAPYIKSIFWICMKPKYETNKKKLKNSRERHQVISDNVY